MRFAIAGENDGKTGATTAMTHIALTGESNGSLASWMEKVSGGQYGGK